MGPVREALDPYDAVVLTGGGARRLGGTHKPEVPIGGLPVVERVAAAVTDAGRLLVVGSDRGVPDRALVTREEPPGSGPVAAVAAAMSLVTSPWLALLAADLPFLARTDIIRLRELAATGDGAVMVDRQGREQWLVGVWRTEALRQAVATMRQGSLARLLRPLLSARHVPATPAGRPSPWWDCDTWDDVDRARWWAAGAGNAGGAPEQTGIPDEEAP